MGDSQLIKLIQNKINDFTYPQSGVLLCMYSDETPYRCVKLLLDVVSELEYHSSNN